MLSLIYLGPQSRSDPSFRRGTAFPVRFSNRLLPFGYACFREDLNKPLALDNFI